MTWHVLIVGVIAVLALKVFASQDAEQSPLRKPVHCAMVWLLVCLSTAFICCRHPHYQQTVEGRQFSKAVTGDVWPSEATRCSARTRSLTFLCDEAVLRMVIASCWLHRVCALVLPTAMSRHVRAAIAACGSSGLSTGWASRTGTRRALDASMANAWALAVRASSKAFGAVV